MAKNITKSGLSTRNTPATRAATRNSAVSGPLGSTANSRKTNLMQLRAALTKNSTTGGDGRTGAKELAIAYLSTVGCSVPESRSDISKKGYCLLSDTTDTEMVENENILDLDRLSLLANKTIGTSDKFSNVDDPFYNLDDGLSRRQTLARQAQNLRSEPDLSVFAAALNAYKNSTPLLGEPVATVSTAVAAASTSTRSSLNLDKLGTTSRTRRSPTSRSKY